MEKSYVHVYTGNGKGKTTAAVGLAVRAAFAGKKVYIGQFIKGMKYKEVQLEEVMPSIKFEQYGQDCFIEKEPTEEDMERAREGLEKIKNVLSGDEYDLVILDEITIAIFYKLFDVDEVIDIIKNRNPKIEVVVTGRYAPEELIEFADLVTEMKEVKHYYYDGVLARDGIER